MDAKRNFSKKLKELRGDNNMSQTQLAKKLGVSRVTISYYENGERTADIDFIYKVAKLFACSTDYLLGLSEYANAEQKEHINKNTNEITQELNDLAVEDRRIFIEIFHKMLKSFKMLTVSKELISEFLPSLEFLIIDLYVASDMIKESELFLANPSGGNEGKMFQGALLATLQYFSHVKYESISRYMNLWSLLEMELNERLPAPIVDFSDIFGVAKFEDLTEEKVAEWLKSVGVKDVDI